VFDSCILLCSFCRYGTKWPPTSCIYLEHYSILQDPFEYEDSDALNVAVSGAEIPDLLNQTTNLRNQLKELNEVSNSYQLAYVWDRKIPLSAQWQK